MTTPQTNRVTSGDALVKSFAVSAAPCNLKRLSVVRPAGSGASYLMIFDATSLPANGASPIWRRRMDATSDVSIAFNTGAIYCPTGCVVAMSSTSTTLTLEVAAEVHIHALID